MERKISKSGSNRFTATLALCLGLTMILAGHPGLLEAVHGDSDREILVGDIMPPTSHTVLDGTEVSIPADADITVVLFWATWSPRSAQALELWDRFSKKYADQSLYIVTFNAERDELTPEDRSRIEAYAVETSGDLPVAVDEGLELFNAYGVKALPTVFFLDREGKLIHRYPSFPTSAPLDLEEELEIRLGIRERQTEEEVASRGKLDYQPKNNALLYYNMAVQLKKKGFSEKARMRLLVALERDPEYKEPLIALEEDFFAEGRTSESEKALGMFLMKNGFTELSKRYSEGQ